MTESNKESLFTCSSQLIGIFLGGLFGFIMYGFLPENPEFALEMGARFYSFLFSVVGWLLSLVINGKCIFCGGVEAITDGRKVRYQILFILLLICIALLPLLLFMSKSYAWFYGVSFLLIVVILGEVGQDDPLYILKGYWVKSNE